MMPSSVYQLRIERIESSTERMKQALPCWGTPFTPMLNQTGELKAAFWVIEEVLQFGAEGLGLFLVDEVVALDAPGGDGVDDAVDDLLQRGLALGRAERAAEVLLGEDVGRVERPARGHLDVELLEGDRAVAKVRDARVATVPESPRRRGDDPRW